MMTLMTKTQQFVFAIFLLIALAVFLFPLIISIITKNYWYFFMFSVSWIPAFIIAKMGEALSD